MKKTEKLAFRCTKETKRILESNARKRNMSQTDYLEYLIHADRLDNKCMDYSSLDRKIQETWHRQVQDKEDIRNLMKRIEETIQNAATALTKDNQHILILSLENVVGAYMYNAEKREATLEDMHEVIPISHMVLFEKEN